MKAVILAGGLGTRLSEETSIKPKPMVEVGGMPILWHIMKIYSHHGINDFIVCCGYKGHVIKEFFNSYRLRTSSVRFDLNDGSAEFLDPPSEPWTITLVDTGETTMTGGRIKRVREYIGNDTFCLTYGDGVANVNVTELIKFHRTEKTLATLTAVQPPGRFGAISLSSGQNRIRQFQEKPTGDGAWINGGFFVVEPEAIDQIDEDATSWEQQPLSRLARSENLSAFRHNGFWQPMDTLRDQQYLESLWNKGDAPWKIW